MIICYGILSSSTNGQIVSQLIRSLGCESPIVVHHDFSQQPDFALDRDANATVIRDYVPTAWGQWSQAEAILRLLKYALSNKSFDYFQLLSETCLPIRPTSEFCSYLEATKPDACIGLIKIQGRADDVGTLNYGWRYLAGVGVTRKLIGLLSNLCKEREGLINVGARDFIGGLSVVRPAERGNSPGLALHRVLLNGLLALTRFSHPFNAGFHCYVGSTWLCLSRKAVEHIFHELESRANLVAYYKNTLSPDESIIHTLIGNSGFKHIVGFNHYLSWRERANGPDELTMAHLPVIRESRKFFARKFSKLTDNELRSVFLGCRPTNGASSSTLAEQSLASLK